MRIHPATMADYEAICTLMMQVDTEHREALPDYFREAETPRSRAFIEAQVGQEARQIWLAEDAGTVLGLVQFEIQQTPDNPLFQPRRFVQIDTLVVSQQARRHGLGRALMQAVHDWALARGVQEFELGVYVFNQGAIQFYESLGYEVFRLRMRRKT